MSFSRNNCLKEKFIEKVHMHFDLLKLVSVTDSDGFANNIGHDWFPLQETVKRSRRMLLTNNLQKTHR